MKHTRFLQITRVHQEAEIRTKDNRSGESHLLSVNPLVYRRCCPSASKAIQIGFQNQRWERRFVFGHDHRHADVMNILLTKTLEGGPQTECAMICTMIMPHLLLARSKSENDASIPKTVWKARSVVQVQIRRPFCWGQGFSGALKEIK